MKYLFFVVLALLFTFLSAHSLVYAFGPTVVVDRGSGVNLHWHVIGAPDCAGSFSGLPQYPNTADGIRTFWVGPHTGFGTQSFPAVTAPPGDYTFVCSAPGPLSDTVTLSVKCPDATPFWNGSDCVVPPPVVNGAVGPANGVPVSAAPSSGLCSAGTPSAVSGSGPWSWTCLGSGGGTNANGSAPVAIPVVNGAVGPANGVPVSAAPSSGLCSAGTPSAVSGSGPWSWTCLGSGGGTNANGSAPVAPPPPTADLTPSTPSVSSGSVQQGGSITLNTNTIRNVGTAVAGPHNIGGFYIDYDNDGNDDYYVPIPRQTANTAAGGGSYSLSVPWTVPVGAPIGSNYRVSYLLDTGSEVTEGAAGEGNNFSGWSSNFTVSAAMLGCPASSSDDCVRNASAAGTQTGSCAATHVGSCQFECDGGTGTWVELSNTCTLPADIQQFEVCDASLTTCGPSITVPINTPLVIRWDTDPDSAVCGASGASPADFSAGNTNNGSDPITANSVSGVSDTYTLQCTNGGAPTIDMKTVTVNTTFVNPVLTVRKDGTPVNTVKIGDDVTVGWDSNNTNETLCSLTGGGLNIPNLPPGGDPEEGASSLITIQGRTTFTITCGGLIGTKTIDVVPQGWES